MARSRLAVMPYAAGLALVLTLTACGGEEETPPVTSSATITSPGTTATSTPTATPTTSVDPVLARIPAAARPETQEGAEAFASFFLESLNEASTKPDASVLDGLYEESCRTCVAMQRSIDALQASGQRHAGDTIRVLETSTIAFTSERRTIRVDVDQLAADIIDSDGRIVGKTTAAQGAFAMTVKFQDGRWLATALQTM